MGLDTVLMGQSRTPSSNVAGILARHGVTGYSQSVGWSTVERSEGVYDFSTFDAALRLAQDAKVSFQPRVRAGAATPEFHIGRAFVPTSGVPAGKTVPVPVNEDGTSNQEWLTGYAGLCRALDDWAFANLDDTRDGPIHRTWFGGGSAEIYVSDQMLALPGVTLEAVTRAYLANLQVAAAPSPFPVELPISGLEAGDNLRAIQGAIQPAMAKLDAARAGFWTQRNGFADGTTSGVWGGPTPPPHGLQMVKAYRPDGSAFNWSQVYAKAARSFSVMPAGMRGYLEVYEQSFTGAGAPQLLAQAAAAV